MSARPKKKLCWNCEANVQFGIEACPYCGVAIETENQKSQDTKRGNIRPPYKLVDSQSDQGVPKSPFATIPQQMNDEQADESNIADEVAEKSEEDPRLIITTMAMLMGGGIFFLFGLILLLFSNEGYLQLRWNDDYWFIYLLIALPMLYLGIQNLGKFRNSNEL